MMGKNFRETLNEQLKDPAFKREYDELEPEFAIINAIIDARKEMGLTQKQLSELTGITQADISKLENGNANPSLKTLQRLAAAMGKSVKISFVKKEKGFPFSFYFPRYLYLLCRCAVPNQLFELSVLLGCDAVKHQEYIQFCLPLLFVELACFLLAVEWCFLSWCKCSYFFLPFCLNNGFLCRFQHQKPVFGINYAFLQRLLSKARVLPALTVIFL